MATQQTISSIQQTLDQFIQTLQELPEDIIRLKPTEAEWSIMEIVCHVLEAVPYWMNQIEKIKAAPEDLWGRNHLDEARNAAVNAADSRTVAQVLKELQELKQQVASELGSLDEATLNIVSTSKNPNFGTKPISFIVDHLIVEHVSKHFGQVQRNLSKIL
jgi:uncharacterized damage-inducible protein DinB